MVLFDIEYWPFVQKKKKKIIFGARSSFCVQTKTEKWTGMFLPGPAHSRTPSSTIHVMALWAVPSGVGQSAM